MYCGCKMNREVTLGLPYAISLQHQSKPLTTTVSPVCLQPGQPLDLWLKQPTCFCSVHSDSGTTVCLIVSGSGGSINANLLPAQDTAWGLINTKFE